MTTVKTKLNVDEMEVRLTPSTATLLQPPAHAIVTTIPPVQQVLSGMITGQFSSHQVRNGQAVDYRFAGFGQVTGLGRVSMSAVIRVSHQGQVIGMLALATRQGTLMIQVEASRPTAASILPENMNYRVLNGSGAFAHLQAQGQLQLILSQIVVAQGRTSGAFTVRF